MHNEALEAYQSKYSKNNDTQKSFCLLHRGYSSSLAGGWRPVDK